MFTQIVGGLILSFGLLFTGSNLADSKPVDCCKERMICCGKDKACCLAASKVGCCANAMACCGKDAGCCSAPQPCCAAGNPSKPGK